MGLRMSNTHTGCTLPEDVPPMLGVLCGRSAVAATSMLPPPCGRTEGGEFG